ncbi:MAG TPA: crotonase/enoyl-CoA hydratase family protein [Caldimonas sp.]|nr:crotonase/enoyl-CoA hydratase family protein [Caldimonas sp.]HEX2540248.1 crotonase/enoyl-CoA hydratase family protein [Caldimonas sp.]
MSTTVRVDRAADVWTVTIARPQVRNAVDGPTARSLAEAFRAFDADATAKVAVLHGEGAHFCAGADLRTVAAGSLGDAGQPLALALADDITEDGPMGPTRLALSKPVIAAVEGYAVAGGLELALWCDLRVASATATFGVFCRRFGVPLIDGGTVRLPRLIGESRAMDLILTGRAVGADEALALGLANRVVGADEALAAALVLAHEIAAFPQQCMRNDRASVRLQHGLPINAALAQEFALGRATLDAGEAVEGARRFVAGTGRHGRFDDR